MSHPSTPLSPATPPAPEAPFVLDQPLPAEVAGSGHSGFTRYRAYPVFSRPWVRGRLQRLGGLLAVTLLLFALTLWWFQPADERPWPGFSELAVTWALPLCLGPWLGWQVRRRAWAPRREAAALGLVMLGMVLMDQAFNQWLAEPMKQFVAEQVGMLGPDGQRQRVTMMIGISVGTGERGLKPPDGEADTPATAPADRGLQPLNMASRAVITWLLAGGLGLLGWRRERVGLAALAQARALAEAQARRREAELRLSVLAAQVEPHFLFNTLAGVRSAIATDPHRASDMIDHLVDYLRAAIPRLRSDGSAQATVGGQFDTVRAYLGLMAARMPRLAFSVEAPAELLGARCPPLMLISLVENAVKHGVEPKVGPARITVRAATTAEGQLALTVADDGVGFGGHSSGSGLGLANVRERLAQLHGDAASLQLRANPEGGVAATLTLPLEVPLQPLPPPQALQPPDAGRGAR